MTKMIFLRLRYLNQNDFFKVEVTETYFCYFKVELTKTYFDILRLR